METYRSDLDYQPPHDNHPKVRYVWRVVFSLAILLFLVSWLLPKFYSQDSLSSLNRVKQMEKKIEAMERSLDKLRKEFDSLKKHLERVDGRVDRVD
jgi:septal ring factor EnvC (AmiA/AmiB activator)